MATTPGREGEVIYRQYKDFYLFVFREREREGEREREKQEPAASHIHPNQGPNPQPRHVPDRESNQRPFALQDDAQPTESHQSGLILGNLTGIGHSGFTSEHRSY